MTASSDRVGRARARTVPRDRAEVTSGVRMASAPGRLSTVLLAAAVIVACFAISWSRITPVGRETIWAEDGRFFLQGFLERGLPATLFEPYQGYLHAIPRLGAAFVAGVLPVEAWAGGLTVVSCVVAALASGIVFVCARSVLRSTVAAVIAGVLPAVLPVATVEVSGNLANVHWYLIYLAVWMVLVHPRSRAWTIVLTVVALLAALTEIQLLAPLVVGLGLQLFRATRARLRWPVLGALAVGVAAQVLASILMPRDPNTNAFVNPLDLLFGYLLQVVTVTYRPVGADMAGMVQGLGWWVPALLVVPFVAALVYVLVKGTNTERITVGVLAAFSVGLWTIGVEANRDPQFAYASYSPEQFAGLAPARYGVVPSLLLLAIVAVAIGSLLRGRLASRIVAVVGIVALVVLSVVSFSLPYTHRAAGPEWSASLVSARDYCARDADGSFDLANAPANLGWYTLVPCSIIR